MIIYGYPVSVFQLLNDFFCISECLFTIGYPLLVTAMLHKALKLITVPIFLIQRSIPKCSACFNSFRPLRYFSRKAILFPVSFWCKSTSHTSYSGKGGTPYCLQWNLISLSQNIFNPTTIEVRFLLIFLLMKILVCC